MISSETVNHSLNLGLHVVILFTFLTIFFFLVISKLEVNAAGDALTDIIDEQTGKTLDQLYYWDATISKKPIINWPNVNNLAEKIVKNSQGPDPKITKINSRVKITAISMVVILFILWIGSLFFFKFIKKIDVGVTRIFIENLVIFAFVGMIEYFFFMKIASKITPVTPDFVAVRLIERIKFRVDQSFDE